MPWFRLPDSLPSGLSRALQQVMNSNAENASAWCGFGPKLTVLKKLLFGFWEMNWISCNATPDVSLRGSSARTLPFLIYPQVETGEGRFDSLDGDRLSYQVSASRAD